MNAMIENFTTSDESHILPESFEFKTSRKAVCALSKLSLGILVVCVVILVVITAVTTYFVTKDAIQDDNHVSICMTTNASATTTTTAPTELPFVESVRLNKTLIPTHYNLEFQPYIYDGDDFSFNGSVKIWFK